MKFLAYSRLVKSNWKAALAAIVVPTVCLPLHLCPPWPDSSGSTSCAVAAVVGLTGLLIPYAMVGKRAKDSAFLAGGAISAALCLVVYIACYSLWVGEATQSNGEEIVANRFVKGTTIAVPVDNLSEEAILKRYGYRVESVYTRASLLVTRLAILLSFSGIFFFITIAFGFSTFRITTPIGKLHD